MSETIEDTLTDEEKKEMEQAAIEAERSKTKYGDGLPEGHRENDE